MTTETYDLEESNRDEIASVFVDIATVPRPGYQLYCLAPNFGRISFQSQQVRAINLVWALQRKGLLENAPKVAVVGGGIAGLTAAITLRGYGANVSVFDPGEQPLQRLKDAIHRNIYPNLNFWPIPEDEIKVTTELPFLDWYMGLCGNVIQDLIKQWDQASDAGGSHLQFFGGQMITGISSPPVRQGKIELTTDRPLPSTFDLVIIASGFGEERDLNMLTSIGHEATPSYWDTDNLERKRAQARPDTKFLVSGFGDGGQIDALRLVYEFRFGEFAFEAASKMPREIADQVREIEKDILDLRLMRSKENTDEIESRAFGYRGIAEKITNHSDYKEYRLWLDKQFRPRGVAPIDIIDQRLSSPYLSAAAPIHKFLIAYAYHNGNLDYKKAELAVGRDILGSDFNVVDANSPEMKDAKIVIRHGASYNDTGLLTEAEWQVLEQKQENSNVWTSRPSWGGDRIPVPEPFLCKHEFPERFASQMRGHAQKVMGLLGETNPIVTALGNKFQVFGHEGYLKPSTIFGLEAEYFPMDALDTAQPLNHGGEVG